ncbi:WD repeat-containing protein [Reticulomyxa filosa]|uniref:WD repeat-containing protein n=1 Tax=Reticulomyxa filosa TaxID=46433 RepID=X6P9C7_RETFI|nr:WD repeat-containing protein [Reticulomyxa filosa]|eukprot:ETO35140.1 WD repeat-containing protein [Reticulomyxa filosa]
MKIVIQYWIRILKVKLALIDDLNNIIIKYVNVIFSADGRKIVSASRDCTVRIWDAKSGKQLQIFRGHAKQVFAARFSPDGNTVVSCSEDGTIRLWDVNTGTEMMKLKSDTNVECDVNFSPDGKYIVSGLQDRTIRLWDIHSGIEIRQLSGHSKSIWSAQFSPDGKMIVSSSHDKTINLWNVESGEILKQFKGKSDCVTRAKFSPDGRFIICSFTDTVRIWHIKTGKSKTLKKHLSNVRDAKYFPDSRTIMFLKMVIQSQQDPQIVKFKSGNYKIKHNFFVKDARYEYKTCFFFVRIYFG